jgi:O-antigen ligase
VAYWHRRFVNNGIAPNDVMAGSWYEPRASLRKDWYWFAFVAAQLPLALALKSSAMLVNIVGLGIFIFGALTAMFWRKRSWLPLYCAVYMVGFELIYRSAPGSILPGEFGKHTVIVILLILILRNISPRLIPVAPVVYLMCLVPSTGIALIGGEFDSYTLWRTRRFLTWNLLGPVALALFVIYFSQLRLNRVQLRNLVVVVVASAIAGSMLGIWNVTTMDDIRFTHNSNFLASGGGGPNQVSNTLALASMLCLLMMMQPKVGVHWRLLWFSALVTLVVAMLFTFSRGGVWALAFAIVAALFEAVKQNRFRARALIAVCCLVLLTFTLIWPKLNQYTSGKAAARYTSLHTSRWALMEAEFRVWMDHPFLGVGPGLARFAVIKYLGHRALPHSEFSRLMAEHGVFGILAIIIIMSGFWRAYWRPRQAKEWRIWVVAIAAYCCIYWLQAATRTIGPSFLYGLMWVTLVPSWLTRKPGNKTSAMPVLRR